MNIKPNKKFKDTLIFYFLLVVLPVQCVSAGEPERIQTEELDLLIEEVAVGLGVPWGMSFLTADKLLITEREGNVKLLELSSSKTGKTKISTINNSPKVLAEGQGGLLDVAAAPDYESSGWIYFTYVKDIDDEGVTVLARAKLQNDRLTNWHVLLQTKSASSTGRHYGSRIAFDKAGHVYFSIGDRGRRPNGQQLDNHAGSIIRLNLDGSVPDDNPFVNNAKALDEIWSYGHRNPQGLVYDKKNNRLWSIEHGPRGGDEINLIQRGENYGWPVISYGKEYWGPISVGEGTHREGMQQPVKVYTPSIAPGSLMLVEGDTFSTWKGNLLSGALKLQHINRVVLNKKGEAIKEERLLENMGERIRAITQSPDERIYFSTDSGKVFRMKPYK